MPVGRSKQSLVKAAKAATSTEIQQYVPLSQIVKDKDFRVCDSKGISQLLRDQIWSIFEKNMKETYENTDVFDWNPTQKQTEIFHELARFLLVSTNTPGGEKGLSLLAYAVFRFEREDKRNVIYVYELQTVEIARRLGLGRSLVHNLDNIGRHFGMDAIMLTHFKVNSDTKVFYDGLRFKVDKTSPDYEEDDDWSDEKTMSEECEYTILSRSIEATDAT